MTEFTPAEKELILRALEIMFKAGAVRGDVAYVAGIVGLARNVEGKLVGRQLAPIDAGNDAAAAMKGQAAADEAGTHPVIDGALL